jgi:UDP-sugar transporter A1/2/3
MVNNFCFCSVQTNVIFNDWDIVVADGFFRGYNSIVWTVVGLQAGGGLVVAIVVKYADNVLKGFATSISVVLSCVVASFIFHGESQFNPLFMAGALIVCMSAFLFSSFPRKAKSAVVKGSLSHASLLQLSASSGEASDHTALLTDENRGN